MRWLGLPAPFHMPWRPHLDHLSVPVSKAESHTSPTPDLQSQNPHLTKHTKMWEVLTLGSFFEKSTAPFYISFPSSSAFLPFETICGSVFFQKDKNRTEFLSMPYHLQWLSPPLLIRLPVWFLWLLHSWDESYALAPLLLIFSFPFFWLSHSLNEYYAPKFYFFNFSFLS